MNLRLSEWTFSSWSSKLRLQLKILRQILHWKGGLGEGFAEGEGGSEDLLVFIEECFFD